MAIFEYFFVNVCMYSQKHVLNRHTIILNYGIYPKESINMAIAHILVIRSLLNCE